MQDLVSRLRMELSDRRSRLPMRLLSCLTAIGLAAGLAAQPAMQPAAEPERAEYAMRWDVEEGGPRTAKKALKVLGKEAEEPENYKIRYFDFTPPEDAPAGFTPILRKRKSGGKHELTFKYRGDHSLPSWRCPVSSAPDESKGEVDVSILADGRTKRSYSYSCTVESKKGPIDPPEDLEARPKDCANRMKRLRAGKLKVEEWDLPGGITLVEVSRNGANTQADLESFQREIVDKLIAAGVKPSDRSKTEIGSDCR